ncbi:MAG: response regulator [Lachnospirales bacterium]
MYSVFLVEDEDIIRDGIKQSVKWEENGFKLVGDAPDGELALPLIKKFKPDILVTDIQMPFMNGIELSSIVKKDLPNTTIIFLSSHEDFTYAKEAIAIGVSHYVIKTLSREQLIKALLEVKTKKDKELEQTEYLERFNNEMQGYLASSKRDFLDILVSGKYSTTELLERASNLDINLFAESYNVVIFLLETMGIDKEDTKDLSSIQKMVYENYPKDENTIVFNMGFDMIVFLLKSQRQDINMKRDNCVRTLEDMCKKITEDFDFYISFSEAVNRISHVANCYKIARAKLFNRSTYEVKTNLDFNINDINNDVTSNRDIMNFLNIGLKEETETFVNDFLMKVGENAMESFIFRQYILLNSVFSVKEFLSKIDMEDKLEELDKTFKEGTLSASNASKFLIDTIFLAIDIRDRSADSKFNSILNDAIEYIDENYQNSSISLKDVTEVTGVSKTYFSSIFSQKMNKTFVEYITELRMNKAKELLLNTDMASGEIAFEVGYNDSHYFSFLFKKVNGYSPREFRARRK